MPTIPGANSAAGLLARLRQRGVLRVAFSYAVIGWLLLQIGDVVLGPLGAPGWVMRALIVLVGGGFPVALALAWYFNLTPSGIERDTLPEGTARPVVHGPRRYADVVIIGVLLVTVILLLARQEGWLEVDRGTPVIGVLPFTELGVAEAEAYFGDGLADTLTYKLGQLKQLMVLAPSSTFKFRGANQDLQEVGAKLGATALLQGTVRRAGGMLRVNARLVDMTSGQQLWSGSYDRAGSDLFAVQDEIATAVTDALQLVLSPEETGRVTHAQTTELSAYDAFLLGQARVATREGTALAEGADYFRQAIRIDPDYALAHAALAEALYLATTHGEGRLDWQNVADEARAAADQAQALDAGLGEGYLAQAFAAMGDNDFGDGSAWPKEHIAALLQRAVELSPNNATALKFYATFAASKQDGLAMLRRAAQLDPRSAIVRQNIGDSLAAAGDYAGALDSYLQAAQLVEPYFQLAHTSIPVMFQFLAGETDQAARWARALYRAHPDRESWILYLRALLGLGAWTEVQQLLDELVPLAAPDDLVIVRVRAALGLAKNDCGEVGRALATLQRLVLPGTWSLQGAGPAPLILEPVLLAQALCETRAGQVEQAQQLLESAMPELAQMQAGNVTALALRSPVLLAALYKSTGQAEPARQALEGFLKTVSDAPMNNFDGVGFARFLALAVQGETAAALTELEAVAALGWSEDWWLLEALNFDPDVAKVTADPRFQSVNARLQERVRRMREDYLANPELPEDLRRRAGLGK